MSERARALEQAKCALCGEPMSAGEEMFKIHGYSGPCPKPALPPGDAPPSCQWREEPVSGYRVACNGVWAYVAAVPISEAPKFCPFCGKPLVLVPAKEPHP